MHLFTNGCSFTWGGGIVEEELGARSDILGDDPNASFRSKSVWPHKLHEMIGSAAMTNLAIGCGSNRRILRTTLEHFTNLLESGSDPSLHVAVIQWTEPSRFEVYDPDRNVWMLIKPGVVIPEVTTDRYKHLQARLGEDDTTHANDLFGDMVALSSFFDKWNIRYLFTSMVPITLPNDWMMSYCKRRMNWFNGFGYSLTTAVDESQFRYESTHPNIKGHARIASQMYSQMSSMGWCH